MIKLKYNTSSYLHLHNDNLLRRYKLHFLIKFYFYTTVYFSNNFYYYCVNTVRAFKFLN